MKQHNRNHKLQIHITFRNRDDFEQEVQDSTFQHTGKLLKKGSAGSEH